MNEERERDRDTPRGVPVDVVNVGGDLLPPEENADLPEFIPERTPVVAGSLWRLHVS